MTTVADISVLFVSEQARGVTGPEVTMSAASLCYLRAVIEVSK